jgi:hypothetical protein
VAGILLIVPTFGYLGSASLLACFYLFSITLNVRKSLLILKEKPVVVV